MTAIGVATRLIIAIASHEHVRAAGRAVLRGAFKELVAHVKRTYRIK